MVRSVCPAKLEQYCISNGFGQTRGAEPQVTTFGGANANAVVGEDFGMPVVARGDVDNQAGSHKELQNHQSQSERPDPTA